jgi:hypothetical protein
MSKEQQKQRKKSVNSLAPKTNPTPKEEWLTGSLLVLAIRINPPLRFELKRLIKVVIAVRRSPHTREDYGAFRDIIAIHCLSWTYSRQADGNWRVNSQTLFDDSSKVWEWKRGAPIDLFTSVERATNFKG